MSASQKNSKIDPQSLTNFLVIYFDCSYLVCCSPFRFVREENGLFVVKKGVLHSIICALQHTLAILYIIAGLRDFFTETTMQDSTSPLKYFRLLNSVFMFAFQILTLKNFWFQQNRFLAIINFIQNESHVFINNSSNKTRTQKGTKLFTWLMCILFTGIGLYKCFWRNVLVPIKKWDKTSIWNRELVSTARHAFFIPTNNLHIVQEMSKPNEFSVFDYCLAVTAALAEIQRGNLASYPDLCVLMAVVTVWTASHNFSKHLCRDTEKSTSSLSPSREKSDRSITFQMPETFSSSGHVKPSRWSDIYREYCGIRELCELVNQAFGSMVMAYLASFLMYQATNIDAVLVTPHVESKIPQLFFMVTSITILLLSAAICENLATLRAWMSKEENRRDIPLDQQNIVLGELGSREIGIRGSNIFTITYPVLWNLMTTVVTYFIICMQTRQQEANEHHQNGLPTNGQYNHQS